MKCLMINYYVTDGIISRFDGINQIRKMVDCGLFLELAHTGRKCDSSKAILTKTALIHLYNNSIECLADDVEVINNLYSVKNENGVDIIYDKIDSDFIRNWYNS